jgi:hypothetical protein
LTGDLEGALVEIFQYDELVFSGITDANGEYEVTLPIGTYSVRLSKSPGYRTHTYVLEFLRAKEIRVLNLPINPIWMSSIHNTDNDMSEGAFVSKDPAISNALALTPSVTLFTEDPFFTLSLTAAAVKSPATWRLKMLPPISTDGGQNDLIPADAVSPAVGDTDSAAGVTVPTIMTTKQFLLYYYSLLGGVVVNSNSAVNYELVSTVHNYTVAAQTLGSYKTLLALFRKAWECVISVDGAGTTNKTGTWEILEGQIGPAATATPTGGHVFLWWTLDGTIVSLSTAYTPPISEACVTHQLVAHFL